MRLTDLPMYGHLPAPAKRQPHNPRRIADHCPECPGYVTETGSDDPRHTRWTCSRHCGWSA